jgi:hypothetical protein
MRKKFLINSLVFLCLFILLDYGLFFLLRKGLDKYYGFGKSPDILIVGSSASLSGYDIEIMESTLGRKVALYAQEGSSLDLRHTMLNHFLNNNKASISLVLFEISPRNFFNRGLAENSHKLFYPYMEDPVIDEYIAAEETKRTNYYIHKLIRTSRFNYHLLKYSFQGHLGFSKNVKNSIVDTTSFAHHNTNALESIILDSAKVNILEKSIKLIRENNAMAVLVNFPVTTFLQETYNKDDYVQYLALLTGFALQFEGVSFIDLNVDECTDYHLFSDRGHLNRMGQLKFTREICKKLD